MPNFPLPAIIGNMFGGDRRPTVAERREPTILNDNSLTEYADLPTALAAMMEGHETLSGVNVSSATASRFAVVGSCIRVLSDDLSALPCVLFRKNGQTKDRAIDLPQYNLLLRKPNEWQTASDFFQMAERHRLFRGITYSLLIRNTRKQVVEMIPLMPDAVELRQDPSTLAISYVYTRRDGVRTTFSAQDILAVRYATNDGLTPLTPISLYKETIGDGIAMRQHGSSFFSKGARPGGILYTEKKVPAEDKAAMREDWERMHSGPDNSHRTAILDQGIKYEKIGLTMEDAQWIEARKFNRSEICGIFGVPPHRVGDLDKATFSNIEHQGLQYVTNTFFPIARRWEQALETQVAPDDGEYEVRFDLDELQRGDFKTRQEGLQILRRNGILSANEWRERVGLNPRTDPGGDAYIIESNMTVDDGTNDFKQAPSDPKQPEDPGQQQSPFRR